jgi:hypothetical protein
MSSPSPRGTQQRQALLALGGRHERQRRLDAQHVPARAMAVAGEAGERSRRRERHEIAPDEARAPREFPYARKTVPCAGSHDPFRRLAREPAHPVKAKPKGGPSSAASSVDSTALALTSAASTVTPCVRASRTSCAGA